MTDEAATVSREVVDLLTEWLMWWWDTDEAPVKMPNALHIRTTLALDRMGVDLPVDRLRVLPSGDVQGGSGG